MFPLLRLQKWVVVKMSQQMSCSGFVKPLIAISKTLWSEFPSNRIKRRMYKRRGSPVEKLIDISSYPVAQVLDVLLQDKTTKRTSYGRPTLMRSLAKHSRTRCSWTRTPSCAEPISSAPASRSRRRHRRSERGKKQRCSRQHGFAIR